MDKISLRIFHNNCEQLLYNWYCMAGNFENSRSEVDFDGLCQYLCCHATFKMRKNTIRSIFVFKALAKEKNF